MWEAGKYRGNPISGLLGKAKTGTPQFVVTFEIEQSEGQTREVFLFLSEGSIDNTMDKLDRLGFGGDFANPTFNCPEPVELECRHEEWNGKTREKWDLGFAREHKPLEADETRRLSALWKSRKPSGPPSSKPAGRPATPPARASTPPPSKPSGPPPAKAATPPPAKYTKDMAWSAWEQVYVNQTLPIADWHAAIDGIGKPEDQFTAEDWEAVAVACLPL